MKVTKSALANAMTATMTSAAQTILIQPAACETSLVPRTPRPIAATTVAVLATAQTSTHQVVTPSGMEHADRIGGAFRRLRCRWHGEEGEDPPLERAEAKVGISREGCHVRPGVRLPRESPAVRSRPPRGCR